MRRRLMDTGFGGWTADHTDGFARALAGTGIGLRALAADGQTTQVAHASVALDTLQALEIHADFAAQVALDDIFAILNGMDNLGQLLLGQVLGADARIDIGLGQDIARIGRTDPIDITQGDVDALIGRNFNADDTSHKEDEELVCKWTIDYPWRCLWRALVQMTRMTPLRRTILQFSQSFFTEARTFIFFPNQIYCSVTIRPSDKS